MSICLLVSNNCLFNTQYFLCPLYKGTTIFVSPPWGGHKFFFARSAREDSVPPKPKNLATPLRRTLFKNEYRLTHQTNLEICHFSPLLLDTKILKSRGR